MPNKIIDENLKIVASPWNDNTPILAQWNYAIMNGLWFKMMTLNICFKSLHKGSIFTLWVDWGILKK